MASVKQIIMIYYSLPPSVGGIQSMLKPLAEVFVKQGYLVTFLGGSGSIEQSNIKTSIIPELDPHYSSINSIQRVLSLGSLPENYELKVKDLERKIETQIGNIDNVIIHNIMTMPFNLTATEALWNYMERYPRKNYYFWTHDLAWKMTDHKNFLYERRPWKLLKQPHSSATYICVSEYRRRQMVDLLNLSRRRIKIVPNVLQFKDFFRFCDKSEEILNQLVLYYAYPVVLIPARIIPRKNIERSIKLLALLRNSFPDILAIITGIPNITDDRYNEYYLMLKSLIEEKQLNSQVIFLHDVFQQLDIPPEYNRKVVHDLYFLSHLVMFLSRDEGFGLPLLEAGAARVPIVVSRLPVFREIVGDRVLYLPENESINYNVSRIEKLLHTYKSKSHALLRHVFTKYNWNMIWQEYMQSIFTK